MSEPVSPERRTIILAAIKDRGLSTTVAAKEFRTHFKTIRQDVEQG
jgi:transposase